MPILQHSPITSKWFNDQTTSDLQVHLKDDRVIFCHRLVLTSWSEVWAVALEDKKETSLDLTSHDAATAETCLKYCYTSTIDLTDDNVMQVHLFARQYNLKELEDSCQAQLKCPTITNCIDFYFHFLGHAFPDSPNAISTIELFLRMEFVAVSKSQGFLRLPLELLYKLLERDELIATEDDVLDACLRWLEASPVGSDPQVRERVLQLVRFPMLSAKALLEFKSHPLMTQCDSLLLNRYNFALQWVMIEHLPRVDQAPLRIKFEQENKTREILTHRISPKLSLLIESQILDADMIACLSSMFGSSSSSKEKKKKLARLLVTSKEGMVPAVFDTAIRDQVGPFICIIKATSGHVFGGYEASNLGDKREWIIGSPKSFLFSLKNIPPQKVVKLKRSDIGLGIFTRGCGLHMGNSGGLSAFCNHFTNEDPAFELAPGYESVGSKTLHGKFGVYTPEFMEVFAISNQKRRLDD